MIIALQSNIKDKCNILCNLTKQKYDYYIKYASTVNISHIITHNNKQVILDQIPIGILYGITCIIADNCYIDINKLIKDIEMLELCNISIANKLLISSRCNIIYNNDNQDNNNGNDNNMNSIDSKPLEYAIDMQTLLKRYGIVICNPTNTLYNFYLKNQRYATILIEGKRPMPIHTLDINNNNICMNICSNILSHICNNNNNNNNNKYNQKNIVNTITNESILSSALILSSEWIVWGITKIYETNKNDTLFTRKYDGCLMKIQRMGNEYSSITNAPYNCNYLNINTLLEQCIKNHINILFINKCDVLEQLGIYRMFVDNKLNDYNTFNDMKLDIEKRITVLPNISKIIFMPHESNLV